MPTHLHDRGGVKRNLRAGTSALIPLLLQRVLTRTPLSIERRKEPESSRVLRIWAMIVSTDQTTDRRNRRHNVITRLVNDVGMK